MRRDEEADVARISHSVSTSVLVGISDSFSAEKMTSQKHHNLGAKPKWSAHADLPCMGNDESLHDPYSTVERQIALADHNNKNSWRSVT